RRLAQRVRILAVDAEQAALDVHREAAAQGLGDVAGLARGKIHHVTTGYVHRVAVALQGKGFAGGAESGHGFPKSRLNARNAPRTMSKHSNMPCGRFLM